MFENDDRLLLVYRLGGNDVLLMGRILTNHSMSIADAINLVGINMNEVADSMGWDGWDYDDIDLLYGDDRASVNIVDYLDKSLEE